MKKRLFSHRIAHAFLVALVACSPEPPDSQPEATATPQPSYIADGLAIVPLTLDDAGNVSVALSAQAFEYESDTLWSTAKSKFDPESPEHFLGKLFDAARVGDTEAAVSLFPEGTAREEADRRINYDEESKKVWGQLDDLRFSGRIDLGNVVYVDVESLRENKPAFPPLPGYFILDSEQILRYTFAFPLDSAQLNFGNAFFAMKAGHWIAPPPTFNEEALSEFQTVYLTAADGDDPWALDMSREPRETEKPYAVLHFNFSDGGIKRYDTIEALKSDQDTRTQFFIDAFHEEKAQKAPNSEVEYFVKIEDSLGSVFYWKYKKLESGPHNYDELKYMTVTENESGEMVSNEKFGEVRFQRSVILTSRYFREALMLLSGSGGGTP